MSHLAIQEMLPSLEDRTGKDAAIEVRFRAFHTQNPQVYKEIVRLARIARARGHTRYSVDLLLAVVRFRRDMRMPVNPDRSGFRLNNNYTSRYARLIQAQERCCAECEGCSNLTCLANFFETRQLRTP